jgi:hypothetical protein
MPKSGRLRSLAYVRGLRARAIYEERRYLAGTRDPPSQLPDSGDAGGSHLKWPRPGGHQKPGRGPTAGLAPNTAGSGHPVLPARDIGIWSIEVSPFRGRSASDLGSFANSAHVVRRAD